MSMSGAFLCLALAHPWCLPFEDASAPPRSAPVAVVQAPAPRVTPPAVARPERARYSIAYGVVPIGELELAIAGGAPGATSVRAAGHGSGGVLGLGHMQSDIATEFDLTRLDSRRWVNARSGGDEDLRDSAEQATSGQVSFVRERAATPGAPRQTSARFAAPVLDPIGFLLRLRIRPPTAPTAPQVLYVLDGQALWRVTVALVGPDALPTGATLTAANRFDAEAEPVRWDGVVDADGDRRHRSFRLWLTDDAARVPLRLEMPLGIADVVVALTSLERA